MNSFEGPYKSHPLSDEEKKKLIGDMLKASAAAEAGDVAGAETRELPPPTEIKPKKTYKKATIARRLEPGDEVPKDWLRSWEDNHEQ